MLSDHSKPKYWNLIFPVQFHSYEIRRIVDADLSERATDLQSRAVKLSLQEGTPRISKLQLGVAAENRNSCNNTFGKLLQMMLPLRKRQFRFGSGHVKRCTQVTFSQNSVQSQVCGPGTSTFPSHVVFPNSFSKDLPSGCIFPPLNLFLICLFGTTQFTFLFRSWFLYSVDICAILWESRCCLVLTTLLMHARLFK